MRGVRRDSRRVRVRRVALPRRAGVRVVLVADVHARDDWFPRDDVRRLVEVVNSIDQADAVVLAGDFVGDDANAIEWAAPLLGDCRAPAFATLGNHDHWTDPEQVTAALLRAGVEVLTNHALELAPDVWLAGIDSCFGGAPDPERALHLVPAGAPAIVVGHEPRIATMHDRFLHLAGHTHHGQVRLPVPCEPLARRWYPPHSQPYPRGLYRRAAHDGSDSFVYTTAGVGYSVVSFRACCPPEVVVIDA